MAEVASAYVTLLPSARGFGRKLESGISGDVNAAGARSGRGFGAAFGKAFVAIGAGLGISRILGDSLSEAREAQKVGALTAQVIKTTGGAAKVSAKQVGDLANALSVKVGVDDEAIQSGENVLLTFKNVRNELGKSNKVFDRATKASVDLASTPLLGGDVNAAAKHLGKALNDPVRGMTALGRAGVTFSDQQKAQIKTLVKSGKTLEAQKIILGEVESQVGGAAAATATAGDKFKVSFKNLEESVGTALLPVLDKVATFLTDKVIPALYDLGPVLDRVKAFLQPAIAAVSSFGDGGGKAGERIQQFKETVTSAFASLRSIFESTVSIVTSLWNTFGESLTAGINRGLESVLNIVRGVLRVIEGVFKVFSSLLKGDWAGVWDGLKLIASGALTALKGIIQGGLNTVKTIFSLAMDALGALASAAWDGIKNGTRAGVDGLVGFLRGLPDRILTAIGDLSQVLFNAGKALIGGLIDGITDKFNDLKKILGDITSKIPDLKGPAKRDRVLLRPNGRLVMDGFITGIGDRVPNLERQLGGLTSSIPKMRLTGVPSAVPAGDGAIASGGRSGPMVNIEQMVAPNYGEMMREVQQRARLASADGMQR